MFNLPLGDTTWNPWKAVAQWQSAYRNLFDRIHRLPAEPEASQVKRTLRQVIKAHISIREQICG